MKTLKGLLGTVALAGVLAGCVTEKEIFLPRDIQAEFPADQQTGVQKSFIFLDGMDSRLSADDITKAVQAYKPDVIYLCADYVIEGVSAGEWLVANCALWGHKCGKAVASGAVTTALDDALFGNLDIYVSGDVTEPFVTLNAAGYNFVCGRIPGKNSIYKNGKNTILEETVARDGKARWVVVSRAEWENSTPWAIYQYYWPVYGFSECVFARFGQDSFPSRKDFIFVSEGVMGNVSGLEMAPLRFTFNCEE